MRRPHPYGRHSWLGLLRRTAPLPQASPQAQRRISRQTPFFFVSYARADRARVNEAIAAAPGRTFWIDTNEIAGARPWTGEIVAAVRACRAVLLFCSAESFASPDVFREVSLASRFHKAVIPLVLDAA